MNGEGSRGEDEIVGMEEDVKDNKIVFMWGYLPGALPQRSPLLSPVVVRLPGKDATDAHGWRDVCGGGCGFAVAISGFFFFFETCFLILFMAFGVFCWKFWAL